MIEVDTARSREGNCNRDRIKCFGRFFLQGVFFLEQSDRGVRGERSGLRSSSGKKGSNGQGLFLGIGESRGMKLQNN